MLLTLVAASVISLMGVKRFYEHLRTKAISFTAELNAFSYEGSIENNYSNVFKNDAVLGMRSGEVKHHLLGEHNNMPLSIFEHVYIVRIDNERRVIRHRVAILRHGLDWPAVILNRRGSEHKTMCSYKNDLMQLDNKKFNKRYHVEGNDEDFVIYAVSEEVQQLLIDRNMKADWRLMNGAIVMIERGRLRVKDITRLLDTMEEFIALLPEQLKVELGLLGDISPIASIGGSEDSSTPSAA